ncbi:DNA excision repair protein ERCC-6-like isoform X2 [Poecilia formosa]|uniref:DNA excision repair protein ERCC-6-like isoform X2 n=1 Tax=Poecilia formosa TaxID=48698 RepID=UPI0007BA0696|nr:PREDICTED: DNA excision repair protein ERCC-6-like isoform X2 [Poecilia formosa]
MNTEGCKDDAEVSEVSDRLEKSLCMEDQMETYSRLISDGKAVAKQGDIHQALKLFKQAFSIHQTPKLESRIKKIEELLAENDLEDEDDEFVNVNNSGLMLFKELHDRLYDYQRVGVSFLYGLYRDGRRGGVLADDMGLGKTIQIISFLSGMYDNDLIKHTLLVMPTSLITNWVKEFSKWTPGMRVKDFHGASKAERTRSLEKVQRRGGVIITTYTMLMNNWQQLASFQGKEFCWDYMILDEAHKIKNSSTKTAKSAYAIPSKNRILLTGTPVQNNLREMWTLFDFACQGTLLGTAKTFKTEYENPITRAREKDATPGEKALGSRMSENLMTLIKPYFLRRTKSEVQKKKTGGKEANSEPDNHQNPQPTSGAVMPKLTRKNDLIVWTYLSAVQEDIYRQFISLDHIKELLMTTKSPLAELNILKKLCDHPRLLSANAIAQFGLDQNPEGENDETDVKSIANVSDETLISESGKLVFLLALLERLREEGHRTLVFAHYRTVLDILQRILGNRGFKLLRLDGTITQITEREKLISRFQTDKRYSVFLLTTQVGGVGITLTAANRVVIYDPSWNPATDAQAVDRAYRIGQTENVVIYRLITCGTVEEKIYRRQVFKDSLIRQNTGDTKNPFRYFSRQELKELFTLEDPRSSSTQLQLQGLHSRQRRTDPALDEHIAQLHAMHMFGISDHDLMFSLDVNHDEDPEDQEACHYIEGRVQKAQELMKAESELQMQLAASMASSTEPAWLRQTPDNTRRRSNEKKPRNPMPGLPLPLPDPKVSLEVVDMDRSGSGGKQPHKESSNEVIDLSGDASAEPIGSSSGPDASLIEMTADEKPVRPTRTSETDQQNHSDSDLQQYDASRLSAGLESSHGNFNLELEDSDEDEGLDAADTEEEEQKLLTELQLNGSFSVQKSLTESLCRRTGVSDLDQSANGTANRSANESIVGTKRKRAAVIYDSDEEEQQLIGSFQVLGSSTPKMSPPRSRRSVTGNTSVVSNRSRLQLVIQDSDENESDEEEAEKVLGMNSEQEETAGETLHTEEEEEEEDDEDDEEASDQFSSAGGDSMAGSAQDEPRPEEERSCHGNGASPERLSLEESSVEAELASGEQMDRCAASGANPDSYESLVRSGKERISQNRPDDALDFFLRAIDLRPGDPEVQLITIQLYRQLSHRR